MEIKYLVHVTVKHTSSDIHYFDKREKAEKFFYFECTKKRIPFKQILPCERWSNVKNNITSIDFEEISALTLSSIFELS